MACEPEGCGPKLTCLATWAKARLPSKPPVFSGEGASSAVCGGGSGCAAAPFESFPVALHPVNPVGKRHANAAVRRIILEKKIIYRASAVAANRRSRRRVTTAETA